jgi:transketolase
VIDPAKYPSVKTGARQGGYILADCSGKKPDVVIIATGSEVHLALECQEKLSQEKIETRVVSLPCWNLFESQSNEYKSSVIPEEVPLLFIEAGETLGWHSYLNSSANVIGVDRYGASAPGKKVMEEYGFSVNNVCEKVHSILKNKKQK